MTKITTKQIEAAYSVAKRVYDKEITVDQGAHELGVVYGLNRSSAKHFIEDYRRLRLGVCYTRTLSTPAASLFLDRIYEDNGPDALAAAISSMRAHVKYYEGKRNITLHSLPETIDRHERRLRELESLVEFQARFDQEVVEAISRTEEVRLERLARASVIPSMTTVTTQVYVRNADVVAEVLHRANGVCGICGKKAPFERKDGTPYLEVHHRVQLAHGGNDTVENAVAACPNCHRQAHYGVPRDSVCPQ